jgi:hypothetical protein
MPNAQKTTIGDGHYMYLLYETFPHGLWINSTEAHCKWYLKEVVYAIFGLYPTKQLFQRENGQCSNIPRQVYRREASHTKEKGE